MDSGLSAILMERKEHFSHTLPYTWGVTMGWDEGNSSGQRGMT